MHARVPRRPARHTARGRAGRPSPVREGAGGEVCASRTRIHTRRILVYAQQLAPRHAAPLRRVGVQGMRAETGWGRGIPQTWYKLAPPRLLPPRGLASVRRRIRGQVREPLADLPEPALRRLIIRLLIGSYRAALTE